MRRIRGVTQIPTVDERGFGAWDRRYVIDAMKLQASTAQCEEPLARQLDGDRDLGVGHRVGRIVHDNRGANRLQVAKFPTPGYTDIHVCHGVAATEAEAVALVAVRVAASLGVVIQPAHRFFLFEHAKTCLVGNRTACVRAGAICIEAVDIAIAVVVYTIVADHFRRASERQTQKSKGQGYIQ